MNVYHFSISDVNRAIVSSAARAEVYPNPSTSQQACQRASQRASQSPSQQLIEEEQEYELEEGFPSEAIMLDEQLLTDNQGYEIEDIETREEYLRFIRLVDLALSL